MVQDEEEFPANTEVFKGKSDEVLRHWARNSDGKRFNQWFPGLIHHFYPLPQEGGGRGVRRGSSQMRPDYRLLN